MHGRPRQQAGPADPERTKAAQQKAALFGQLAKEVLERRAARRYDPETLALGGKLLELHPEVYTVWNHRREALQPVLAAGGDAAVTAVQQELALTERALRKNPKSYATWHHRKWVVAKGFSSLEHELQLVSQLLEADERNFHGWGYRRFVVQRMGTPAARELDYAERKINQNFSNYSAWHSRTALLPALYGAEGEHAGAGVLNRPTAAAAPAVVAAAADAEVSVAVGEAGEDALVGALRSAALGGTDDSVAAAAEAACSSSGRLGGTAAATAAVVVPQAALDAEYELVKQAFYTEPEDQSGWFYHRWLLGCSLAHWEQARGTAAEAEEQAVLVGVLGREQAMCEELLQVEPDAKWPLLTLTRLRELRLLVEGQGQAAPAAAAPAAEVAEGYRRLAELDPLRAGYYRDAAEGRAHVVARPTAGMALPR